ncbi:MAG: SpoIIE family protein phosphatase, partial [Bacteroidales bacterium]|nr:SpoIIE family protein phosphatase [Bacteroidales bacterium]
MKKQRTFASKMALILGVSVICIFTFINSVTIYFAGKGLLEKEREENFANAKFLSGKIEETAGEVETNVRSHQIAVNHDAVDFEELQRLLNDMMNDDNLSRAFVCITPGKAHTGENGMMLEIVRNSDGTKTFRQSPSSYKFQTYPYYLVPVRLYKGYWTFPYNIGKDQVITYSYPLNDGDGKIYGVLGADIRLRQITDTLMEISNIDGLKQHIVVTSCDGRYMIHNDIGKIVNETIFTDARSNSCPGLEEIGKAMLAGEEGTREIDYCGERAVVSYTSIPLIGWGISIITPFDDIFDRMLAGILLAFILMLVGMALLIPAIWTIVKKMTQPIQYYANAAERIAEGDFDTPVDRAESRDEIQRVGDSLDDMRISLKDYMARLTETTAVRESIEKELLIARSIQMGMLPRLFPTPPEHKDVSIYAVLHPAKEVGGDLYDFYIKDDNLHFVIGDVSGKGVPASLVMAITSSLFRAAPSTDTPSEVMVSLNNFLSNNNDRSMFVTLIVGNLNLKTGHMRFCNAGHNPMLLLHKGKTVTIEMARNLPVGLMEDSVYQQNE